MLRQYQFKRNLIVMEKEKEDALTKLSGAGGFIKPEDVLDKLEIREGMKIADFGCGAGYFTIPLAKRAGKGGIVYAIDVQSTALESVRGRARLFSALNIETIRADLEKENSSTLKENSLDMVVLGNILFQSSAKDAIIKEAKRVTNKKSGKIVIIEWKEDAMLGPQAGYRISKNDLKKMAKDFRLVLEKEFNAGDSHYGLVFSL